MSTALLPYGQPLYWSFHERPEAWHIDTFHQYAKQLALFGGGRFTHSTHFHDSSLYGNHGTLKNMDPTTDWVRDLGRWATDHDGTNDWVNLGTWNPVRPFTACCLMRQSADLSSPNPFYDGYAICKHADSPRANGWGLAFYSSDNTAGNCCTFAMIVSGSTSSIGASSPLGSVTVEEWVHCGGLWSGQSCSYYQNGVYQSTATLKNGGYTDVSTAPLQIGITTRGSPYTYPFRGRVSDVLIWSGVDMTWAFPYLADPSNVMLSLGGSDPGLIVPDDLVYPVYLPSSVPAGAKPALWLGVCV